MPSRLTEEGRKHEEAAVAPSLSISHANVPFDLLRLTTIVQHSNDLPAGPCPCFDWLTGRSAISDREHVQMAEARSKDDMYKHLWADGPPSSRRRRARQGAWDERLSITFGHKDSSKVRYEPRSDYMCQEVILRDIRLYTCVFFLSWWFWLSVRVQTDSHQQSRRCSCYFSDSGHQQNPAFDCFSNLRMWRLLTSHSDGQQSLLCARSDNKLSVGVLVPPFPVPKLESSADKMMLLSPLCLPVVPLCSHSLSKWRRACVML